jgi:hypothetical protein
LLIVVHFATYNHHKPQNARKLVLHGTENSWKWIVLPS